MSLLDLPGPQFLGVYCLLLAGAAVVAAFLRRGLLYPDDDPPAECFALSAYDVAYLEGGEELAASAALAKLFHGGAVTVSGPDRLATVEQPPEMAPLEQAAYAAVADGDDGRPVGDIPAAVAAQLSEVRATLAALRLLVPAGQAFFARLLPCALVLSVVVLGALKIDRGVARGKSVGLLVTVTAVATIGTLAGFGSRVRRTGRGDHVLDRLKRSNAGLEETMRLHAEAVAAGDVALAVGLFGVGILKAGPLAELLVALKPLSAAHAGGVDPMIHGHGCGTGCGGGCGGCGG
jgi:uncharacterized protein (TIGR04222 family)